MSDDSLCPLELAIGNSTLCIRYCDITGCPVDVIVSSDDVHLSMAGGVSGAILKTGGEEVWAEAHTWAPLELGGIAITTAGKLPAKRIFHAAVLDYYTPNVTTIELIQAVTKKCLTVCHELGFESIAFPALGTGAASASPVRSATAMLLEMGAVVLRRR